MKGNIRLDHFSAPSESLRADTVDGVIADAITGARRLDDATSAFFARELELIKTETFDTKYKPLKSAEFLPINVEGGDGVNEITWRRYTDVGLAVIISDYGMDIPRSDVYAEEFSVKPKEIATSFGYGLFEIARARRANLPLDRKRATAARRAMDFKIDSLAWHGDAEHGIQGFIDYPGTQEYITPDGGTFSPLWEEKTSDEILKDMNDMITTVRTTTNGVESPDTMLMPIAQYELIRNKRVSDYSDTTVLEYFRRNNPDIEIYWVNELAGAGAGESDRIIAYKRDPQHVTQEMPTVLNTLPETRDNFEYVTVMYSRYAGVIIYYPLSVIFADNV